MLKLPPELRDELGTQSGAAGVGALANLARSFDRPTDMVQAWNQIGGFTQAIQSEILKRSNGDLEAIPELVLQAQEGAFDTKRCGSSAADCPHIPDEVRAALLDAIVALEQRGDERAQSLKDFAARHKKR